MLEAESDKIWDIHVSIHKIKDDCLEDDNLDTLTSIKLLKVDRVLVCLKYGGFEFGSLLFIVKALNFSN